MSRWWAGNSSSENTKFKEQNVKTSRKSTNVKSEANNLKNWRFRVFVNFNLNINGERTMKRIESCKYFAFLQRKLP